MEPMYANILANCALVLKGLASGQWQSGTGGMHSRAAELLQVEIAINLGI